MQNIPKKEFPRPERQRSRWLNLNGEWDFRLFPEGHEADERLFARSRAAYNRRIVVPFSWACPLSKVEEDVAGVGWYRRTVRFEASERVFLCFGAVDYRADVFVNNTYAGGHQGGYAYFELDVTEIWQSGDNLIEVRAEDYRRETQTYGKQGYGEIQGVWQTVWLEERPQAYISDFRITAKITGDVQISAQVSAPDGAVFSARFDGQHAEAPVRSGKAELSLHLENPRLWSPDSPNLYEGTVCITHDGKTDEVCTYFGVREISAAQVDGRDFKWILLNGKPIYLNGTLDQAFNPQGYFTYPDEADIRAEVWRLKRLGLNMVRIHIKPEEPRKLYWMDRLGVLVMEDMPCFWGEPNEEARNAYENELDQMIARDFNHPCIFAWVVFNETWGLFTTKGAARSYLPETQEWVRSVYHRAKTLDPTRLVEDNSPCNNDHVESDLNTWHFYKNGYEAVRDHIRGVVKNTYAGSEFNYTGGNRQTGAPLMNSECGLVWGVRNSAGDSDLAWQYHYMLNEYRLHEKLCGFVFTEFHDVVNEFNGYYRMDGEAKDFGYQDFCRGMSLKDLHAADFIAVDCAPMRDANAGDIMTVPLVLSSFSDKLHGAACSLAWELWHDGLDGRVTDASGQIELPEFGYGATALSPLKIRMPNENAVAVLSLYLKDEKGAVVSRNFTTFDVHAVLPDNFIEIPVAQGKAEGFEVVWQAMGGEKLCMGGAGQVSFTAYLPRCDSLSGITLYLEAGAKRILKKDRQIVEEKEQDLGFMRGYRVDRGAFDNSYWMTDESRFPSEAEVIVNGQVIDTLYLKNDWADARGALSWHAQPVDDLLDEAGSYGEPQRIELPVNLLPAIARESRLTVTFRVKGQGGLALYGRESGRYAHGFIVKLDR
ncbi:MAG: glycoside hydrolase family 2 TIM barrel-domain containing protein [Candidatus Aphodomonas sp.]|nr:glycoside hydrolase family 2 TIM barrel-domain containing protein [Candidatus Aphodomonas sp.]